MTNLIKKLDKRDLRRLELFCEIVEQGGISNATLNTGLSQPVLSNQLIELERSLGVTLCYRGRSGFTLTSEGRAVYDYANELNSILSDFAFKLKGVQSTLTGHVRVGVLDNTATFEDNIISSAIEAFYQLSDHIEVSLEIGDYTFLSEKLHRSQLDMMIVVLSEKNAKEHNYSHVTPLFYEKSYLYARKDVASDIVEKQYSLEGRRINVGGYASRKMYQLLNVSQYDDIKLINGWNVESGLILTMAGTHISFLPTHLIESSKYKYDLVALQEENWVIESEFSVVIKNSKDAMTPVAQAFYDCLLTAAKAAD